MLQGAERASFIRASRARENGERPSRNRELRNRLSRGRSCKQAKTRGRSLGSSTRCELDSRKPRPPRPSEATVEAPPAVEAAIGATVEAPIEAAATPPPVLAPVRVDPLQIGFRDGRG